MSPSTCLRVRYRKLVFGAKPSLPRWPRRKLTRFAPRAAVFWSIVPLVPSVIRLNCDRSATSSVPAAVKNTCSVVGSSLVEGEPVGLPEPSQVWVFQVKSTRLVIAPVIISVAPARKSLIVRLSQAGLVLASSFVCADQTTLGSTCPYVGLPVVRSIWSAVSSPVHSLVV